MDTIRLFVGTDPQQHVAERALEASVRRNTTGTVNITWMRAGDPGWDWGGVECGWATPFTWFRWHVPKHCGFEGRAIYMDVDQLALADLRELWEWKIPHSAHGMYAGRSPALADVILWDCARMEDRIIKYMRADAERTMQALPPEWDHIDRLRDNTKILHFSKMSLQPWKPYPERFPYDGKHPDPKAVALFWEYAGVPAPEGAA